VRVVKAHADGNDFLLTPADDAPVNRSGLARVLCHRHTGIGADGLIPYVLRDRGATMSLRNADGSPSELSGNGLRCLAAFVAREQHLEPGSTVTIDTDAGTKVLELLARVNHRCCFRAAMGRPASVRQEVITAAGEAITAVALQMGNPQCVVLGRLPNAERFNRLGPALSTHPMFPAGTNVEFAEVEGPGRVRILIWERGVGPTSSSGTGASAAAVAAAAYGGAARDVEVVSEGGSQRVEWRDDGVFLTGWAEVVLDATWVGALAE
jgi:diaminopimelate epimerase